MTYKEKTKISKVYYWECDCGANGYENTYNKARSRASWHKECNHDPILNKKFNNFRDKLSKDIEKADTDYPKL